MTSLFVFLYLFTSHVTTFPDSKLLIVYLDPHTFLFIRTLNSRSVHIIFELLRHQMGPFFVLLFEHKLVIWIRTLGICVSRCKQLSFEHNKLVIWFRTIGNCVSRSTQLSFVHLSSWFEPAHLVDLFVSLDPNNCRLRIEEHFWSCTLIIYVFWPAHFSSEQSRYQKGPFK